MIHRAKGPMPGGFRERATENLIRLGCSCAYSRSYSGRFASAGLKRRVMEIVVEAVEREVGGKVVVVENQQVLGEFQG